MLESTQNLLLASRDEVKVQKLQEAVKTAIEKALSISIDISDS